MSPTEVGRKIAIGGIAGALASAIGFGLGSRLAMRGAFLNAGPSAAGELTGNGNVVGDITFGGTLFLIVFSAAIGVAGGLAYVVLKDWVPSQGWRKGLLYGLAVLGVVGSLLIDAENEDFRRFGAPATNILIFAPLFFVTGLLVVRFEDLFSRRLPRGPRADVALAIVAVPFILVFLGLSLALVGFEPVRAVAVLGSLAFVLFVARADARGRGIASRRAGYVALAVPCIVGTAELFFHLGRILGVGL